jgi:hypothetical protein
MGKHPTTSHDAMLWIGVEVLRAKLRAAGIEVGYTGAATVDRYRVVLVSITAPREWYRFVRERATWPAGRYCVLVGGAGLTNVEPFLDCFDAAVWGRAEDLIVELVEAARAGRRYRSPSVCWADEYDPAEVYTFSQAREPWPDPLRIGGRSTLRQTWREWAVGCRRRCAFCLYSWTHKPILPAGAVGQFARSRNVETTIWGIDFDNPPKVTAIDGLSERIRRAVRKPISDELLTDTLRRLSTEGRYGGRIKVFNIVGYPGERGDDWEALARCFSAADGPLPRGRRKFGVELHNTPLSPQPCTPLAVAEVSTDHFPREIARRLRRLTGSGATRFEWFRGTRLWAIETGATIGRATSALEALIQRARTADAATVRRLALCRAFWRASQARQWATLTSEIGIERYLRRYGWDELPTANLQGTVPRAKLERIGARVLRDLCR